LAPKWSPKRPEACGGLPPHYYYSYYYYYYYYCYYYYYYYYSYYYYYYYYYHYYYYYLFFETWDVRAFGRPGMRCAVRAFGRPGVPTFIGTTAKFPKVQGKPQQQKK